MIKRLVFDILTVSSSHHFISDYKVKKNKKLLGLSDKAAYRIIVSGHFNKNHEANFAGFSFVYKYDNFNCPHTGMQGIVMDQAMLHGILIKIRDLGLPVILVCYLNPDSQKDQVGLLCLNKKVVDKFKKSCL